MRTIFHEIQKQFGDKLTAAVHLGFHRWHDDHTTEARTISSKRTRSSYANDQIWHELSQTFRKDPRFRFLSRGQARFVEYKNVVLMKVKKINSRYQPSNIMTRAVQRFNAGEPVFPGFDTRIPCILGFRLDALGESVDFIALLRPDIVGPAHIYVLYDACNQVGNILELEPETSRAEVNEANQRRVRVRESAHRERSI